MADEFSFLSFNRGIIPKQLDLQQLKIRPSWTTSKEGLKTFNPHE